MPLYVTSSPGTRATPNFPSGTGVVAAKISFAPVFFNRATIRRRFPSYSLIDTCHCPPSSRRISCSPKLK